MLIGMETKPLVISIPLLLFITLVGCDSYDIVTRTYGGGGTGGDIFPTFQVTERVDKRTGIATHQYFPGRGWVSYKEMARQRNENEKLEREIVESERRLEEFKRKKGGRMSMDDYSAFMDEEGKRLSSPFDRAWQRIVIFLEEMPQRIQDKQWKEIYAKMVKELTGGAIRPYVDTTQ